MDKVLQLIKFKHWIKNLFIFAPLIFALQLFSPPQVIKVTAVFIAFSLVSVLVYIINDIRDKNQDACHPVKSRRPIASGKITPFYALVIGLLFFSSGLAIAFLAKPITLLVLVGYVLLNILYTFCFKYLAILDVFAIAVGFCLRVYIGALSIDVNLSHWMLLTTFSISLVLGFGKRRHELVLLGADAVKHRSIYAVYNEKILDTMIIISTSITAISYALYTMDSSAINRFETKNLIFTVPFVLFGLFRYLLLVYRNKKGGTPETLVVTDLGIISTVLLWLIAIVLIIYFN